MTTPPIQGTALPVHILLAVAISAGVLTLLVYAGIALPAVWSDSPARRKAAADVLRQLLSFIITVTRTTRKPVTVETTVWLSRSLGARPGSEQREDEFSTHEFVHSTGKLGGGQGLNANR
jgi:hypothetical protein